MHNPIPHTPDTLAQSALDAVGAKPYLGGGWMDEAARLSAVEYVVTATLEEFDDKTPEDLKLVLQSVLVLTR